VTLAGLNATRRLPLTLWRNRSLLLQLFQRDVAERYRGSAAGMVWSLLTPLVMLAIYTFVFSVIFNARWGERAVSRIDYALLLFAGLLVFGIFSDCANRAPTLIVARPNFVKKVVFPLELVAVVALGNALFHFAAGFAILMVFCVLTYGSVPWTAVLVPVVLLPLMLFALGITWLLSAIGVFVYDLRHAVPLATTALMFLTPIFYPANSVPEQVRAVITWVNPLTVPVENMRAVAILGGMPDWSALALSIVLNGAFAALCFVWFQRARRHFADVL
jgi:lipopolysaccharide transport system permease protein